MPGQGQTAEWEIGRVHIQRGQLPTVLFAFDETPTDLQGAFPSDPLKMAAAGALPPLIGRRQEMLKITQILLQSRKSNLILVGEPGVGKTGSRR
jgi:ATP-dependent Clp protease ATP-binding subunit ClpA